MAAVRKGRGRELGYSTTLFHVLDHGVDSNEKHTFPGEGGEALPYLAPLFGLFGLVCAAEQGMVFKVSSLKQGIQIRNLVS